MKDGYSEKFLAAYDAHAGAIFRHCYFRLSDREKAMDLSQETFTRAWGYLAQGKEVQNFKPFLYRIASNLIIEEYRKRKTTSLDAMLEEEAAGERVIVELRDEEWSEHLVDQLDGARALQAMSKLPEPYREVLTLRFVDGLTPKEIALFLEERENTVSVRIHRALGHLKKIITT